MNIVIANQFSNLIKNAGIGNQEYIGLYDVNELGNSFRMIQFDSLIIDVTAVKNYNDVSVFKQLINYISAEKIILLLDNNCINDTYLNSLVSMGIYNFAKDINGLVQLINKKNGYADVAGYAQNDGVSEYSSDVLPENDKRHCKVIGFENVTRHAGSTTLVAALVNLLKKKYNVIGIEVDSVDFSFFKNDNLVSTISNKINYLVNKNESMDIILIDTNGSEKAIDVCDEIIYLVEPTTLKINKLILARPTVFNDLFDKKVVLNRSALSKWDVAEFENESRIKTFYTLPLINERDNKDSNLVKFASKLGFKI